MRDAITKDTQPVDLDALIRSRVTEGLRTAVNSDELRGLRREMEGLRNSWLQQVREEISRQQLARPDEFHAQHI